MAHNRMLDRVPSVVITKDRNELKIYQGNIVYLNDGDNFELRFFNPLSFKIGVDIVFNGIKRGDNLLVINPGQDITLERFLDEQRKMIFETYTVDGNNKEAVEAIQNNGDITFNFYEEGYNYSKKDININYGFPPEPIKYTSSTSPILSSTFPFSGSTGCSGSAGTQSTTGTSGKPHYGKFTTNTQSAKYLFAQKYNTNSRSYCTPGISSTTTDNSYLDSSINFSEYVAEDTNTTINYTNYQNMFSLNSMSVTPSPLETGRIEMGELSSQKTKRVNSNFKNDPFYSFSYKLMPISSMNKTISEIRQYCPHCSYRIRNQKWTYCPKCGNKII